MQQYHTKRSFGAFIPFLGMPSSQIRRILPVPFEGNIEGAFVRKRCSQGLSDYDSFYSAMFVVFGVICFCVQLFA